MAKEFNFAELWQSAEPMRSFRDRRHAVMLQAKLGRTGSDETLARVRNISSGGLMAECRLQGDAGERLDVWLRGLGQLSGSLIWATMDRIGLKFDAPVDPAALLRRPSPAPSDYVPRPAQRAWRPPLHGS